MARLEDVVDDWDDDVDEEGDYSLDISLRAYVSGSDWTVGTVLDQLAQGNLDIAPSFQRRSVWDDRRASRFVESLFLGLPIPQLVLAEDKERKGGFVVLDGKQRLLTLVRFAIGSRLLPDSGRIDVETLRLARLDILPDLSGRTLAELETDPESADSVRIFQNRTIRTVVISGWKDDEYLSLVFLRLNSGSVPLSTQELRQALHSGPFSTALNDYTIASAPLQRALGLDTPDFRMRDIELALRFVSFALRSEDYAGNLKRFLDETVEIMNQGWATWEPLVVSTLDSLDAAIAAAEEIFGPRKAFRRFVRGTYESRFNRAVFDVQTLAFRDPAVRGAALELQGEVRSAFELLSESDESFSNALVSTTKSLSATQERLSSWIKVLNRLLEVRQPVPELAQNRIKWT